MKSPDVTTQRKLPSLLRVRGGYFWVEAKFWNSATQKRERVQRSTGVRDDGTKSAERAALVIAEDIFRTVAVTHERRAKAYTVGDAFKANLAAKRRANRSASTLAIVTEKQARIEAFFGSGRDLRSVDDAALTRYVDAAREAGRSPATILREIRELLIGVKVLGLPVPKMPDLGRTVTVRERWLPPDETAKLLAAAPRGRREHILAYRLLGLRKSELFRIEAKDVDVASWMVRVRGTKSDRADRWVPVHPDLRPIFLARMQRLPAGPIFEEWGRGNADRDLRNAAEKAKLGPLSFNDLRRSFAMELLRAGVPAREVAELLGHTSTRMVEGHYARLRPGKHLEGTVSRLAGGYNTSSVPPPSAAAAPSLSDAPTQIYAGPFEKE